MRFLVELQISVIESFGHRNLNEAMTKTEAIHLLGGTIAGAAFKLKVKPSALYVWPEELSEGLEMRVYGALYLEYFDTLRNFLNTMPAPLQDKPAYEKHKPVTNGEKEEFPDRI